MPAGTHWNTTAARSYRARQPARSGDQNSKFEPVINSSFQDFASHYGMTVLPARAYRPRDKALVEGAVKIVYRRIFAPLRDHVFTSLTELNVAIYRELEALNASAFKDRTYSRRQLFEEIEQGALAPTSQDPLRTAQRAASYGHAQRACAIER
ncbi:MAG: hypothetical protein IPI24_02165 [Ignavibacteria bacterium]|nr:hypothetical protein [Ignavibacteria bacterium]